MQISSDKPSSQIIRLIVHHVFLSKLGALFKILPLRFESDTCTSPKPCPQQLYIHPSWTATTAPGPSGSGIIPVVEGYWHSLRHSSQTLPFVPRFIQAARQLLVFLCHVGVLACSRHSNREAK